MEKQQIPGYVMAIIGFAMILVNAFSYILKWENTSPTIFIMGLVFVTIGMQTVRKQQNTGKP